MEEFIAHSKSFSSSPGTLIFLGIFICFISLFHTIIFKSLFGIRLKPVYLITLIYIVAYTVIAVFFSAYAPLFMVSLFALTFVLAIVGMFIINPIRKIANSYQNNVAATKEGNSTLGKWILNLLKGGLISLAFLAAFLTLGIIGPIILIVIISINNYYKKGGNYAFFQTERTLATSTIRGLAIGLAEIQGKTVKTNLLKAPYSSDLCIGYSSTIENISYDDDNKRSYTTIDQSAQINPFYIKDDTGMIRILPEELNFQSFPIHTSYESGDKRYRQYLLQEDQEALLIGQAYWDENHEMVMRKDPNKQLFGIILFETLSFKKQLRPYLQYLKSFFILWCISIVLIINTPMHLEDKKLVIGTPSIFNWEQNINKIKSVFPQSWFQTTDEAYSPDDPNFINHDLEVSDTMMGIDYYPEDTFSK